MPRLNSFLLRTQHFFGHLSTYIASTCFYLLYFTYHHVSESVRVIIPDKSRKLLTSPGQTTLNFIWTHCTGNPIYVFLEMKLRSLVPNSYNIHVSASDLCIPRTGLPIWLQQNSRIFWQTHPANI